MRFPPNEEVHNMNEELLNIINQCTNEEIAEIQKIVNAMLEAIKEGGNGNARDTAK